MNSQPMLTPYDLGGLAMPNRIVMAPMTRSRADEDEVPGPLMATYYSQRASAGLIIAEAANVAPEGKGFVGTPGLYTAEQKAGWRTVVEAVHAAGGRIYAQLGHVGRMSHHSFQPDEAPPVAPSAIAIKGVTWTRKVPIGSTEGQAPFSVPRALETSEVADVVGQYGNAAKVARDAGFDGIEIHGANGYLVDQFLRDSANQRTDRYGGSITNRMRFMLEVVDAVTQAYPIERIGMRLSPGGYINGMADSDPIALFCAVADALSDRKIGYLHLIDAIGSLKSVDVKGESGKDHETSFAPLLRERFRGSFILNGGLDQQSGNAIIANGAADLVSFGALFIANPDLPRRFAENAVLNVPDRPSFYAGEDKGYTDYPALA